MVTVGGVASLVWDQSFASRNRESLLLFKTQTCRPEENQPKAPVHHRSVTAVKMQLKRSTGNGRYAGEQSQQLCWGGSVNGCEPGSEPGGPESKMASSHFNEVAHLAQDRLVLENNPVLVEIYPRCKHYDVS